jgi:hypothetical protein
VDLHHRAVDDGADCGFVCEDHGGLPPLWATRTSRGRVLTMPARAPVQ